MSINESPEMFERRDNGSARALESASPLDTSIPTSTLIPTAVDEAWKFLEAHHSHVDIGEARLRAIRRKIDLRVFPWLSVCVLMQNLDKFSLNYAAVMGLPKDLRLKGNEFSNVATAFGVAFLLYEIPNVYFLQKFPPGKWLGINVILWGIATACTAGVKNYPTLLVARLFLGVFEATSGPSMMTISGQWYTKQEQAPRFSCWAYGNAGAQTLGALMSFGFQHMTGGHLSGWRTMFVVLGCLTILLGALMVIFVPDTPMDARFLSDAEKTSLLKHVSVNRTGIRNDKFRPAEIMEAVRDPQMCMFCIATISLGVSTGVVSTYSATLIKSMGFTSKQTALLSMPSGVVSAISVAVAGYGIRHAGHRWAWISSCALVGTLGAGLLSFLPHSNRAGLLAGIWLINSITATLYMMYHYIGANVSGYTKRSLAGSVIACSFGIGSIIGPQTFQVRDAPGYQPAKIGAMATTAGTAALMGCLALYYVRENRRKEGLKQTEGAPEPDSEAWAGLTDRQNPHFRYVY